MHRDFKASDSQHLVYKDKAYLWIGLPLLAFGLFLVSGSLASIIMHWLNNEPIFGKHGFQSLLFGYVLDFVILALGVRACTERQLVIEREYNRITKINKFFFWKRSENFDTRNFDTVSWRTESKSDDEHRGTRYPITLSGPGVQVDLFEEFSKPKALVRVAEIKEFLQLEHTQCDDVYVPAEGEINVSAGTAYLMVKGFTIVWYLFCSLFVLVGVIFAGTASWAIVQGKMDIGEGLALAGGSLLFSGMAVGFFLFGRKSFPIILAKMEGEVASEQAKRSASTTETVKNREEVQAGSFASSVKQKRALDSIRNIEAKRWRHLKWLLIIPGMMLGCESWVVTTHDGEEVAIRERLIFLWNDQPSATELAKGIDPVKITKIKVSRTFAFGIYSSSSSASVPRVKSKSYRGQQNLTEQAQRDNALSGRWREQTTHLKAWIKQKGGNVLSANTWHIGSKDVEVDLNVDFRQSQIRDEDLEQLAVSESQAKLYIGGQLSRQGLIQSLNFSGCQITDKGLSHLKSMKSLMALYLNDSQITDIGLAQLEGMTQIIVLHLERSRITDAGLVSLTKLSNLANLILNETQITDVGIEHLKKLATLKKLKIIKCQLTSKGVEELRLALPNCEIIHQ